jgi:hypothetical protein
MLIFWTVSIYQTGLNRAGSRPRRVDFAGEICWRLAFGSLGAPAARV